MSSVQAQRRFFPQIRIERLIATSRMVLAALFLMAITLDPSDPQRYARLTQGVLTAYLGYSLVLGAVILRKQVNSNRLNVLSHAVDLLVFTLLMFLTEGPNSPFFVYFIFLLVCATLRWQWRGTLSTAGAALTIVLVLACYPVNLLLDHSFELSRFIIRIVYLAVIATVLGYLGAHEESMRNVFCLMAEWPRAKSEELHPMISELLEHSAAILGAPRLLLVWEEEEEPWLHQALWSREGCGYHREHPEALGSVVAVQLTETSFFCEQAGSARPHVISNSPSGLQHWYEPPLQAEVLERFSVHSVSGTRLRGENLTGYLLALDKTRMNSDDLLLIEIAAREIVARLDHFVIMKQLQQAAATEERIRLARDLHDGLLQSLTGAALQLETAQRLIESDPQTARQRLREIQQLIATEQKDLRYHIGELRLFLRQPKDDFGLPARLEELAQRIRLQWDLPVTISANHAPPRVNASMAREIYFVVHESLYNAVRHAEASALSACLLFEDKSVQITVDDDGHGFAFRGHYDHRALQEMKRGPVTLRERVAALGGTLSIDSQATGTQLVIALPLTGYGG